MEIPIICLLYTSIESSDCDSDISVDSFVTNKYNDKSIISEHIKMLVDIDFIEAEELPFATDQYSDFLVKRITMQGYDFLDDIRSDNIWGKTKNIAEQIGVKSLSGIAKIASNVITEIIRSQLGSA